MSYQSPQLRHPPTHYDVVTTIVYQNGLIPLNSIVDLLTQTIWERNLHLIQMFPSTDSYTQVDILARMQLYVDEPI
jgi:hypothetical protein